MEAHPVPQNVTSFEFRLVGDMTLKQFGYLASGLIVAYLTFVLFFQSNPYIASPIIATSSLLGIAFAFLPINDRPLDHWVKAFFKAVYHPTQRTWQGSIKNVDPKDPNFKNRLRFYLNSTGAANLIAPEEEVIQQTTQLEANNAKIKGLSRLLAPQNNTPAVSSLRSIPTSFTAPVFNPVIQPATFSSPQAQSFPPQIAQPLMESSQSMINPPVIENSLTNTPNIITGVVVNKDNSPIEGAIVLINNANNIPVRALKTNRLGQFLGATPLPAGVYKIDAEKDGMDFPQLTVTLTDTAVVPIRVIGSEVMAHA